MEKKNGLLPGWPPFNEFKKEMADLVAHQVDEKLKPVQLEMTTVKDSLLSHIQKTDKSFKAVDENFKTVNESLLKINNRMTEIDKQLTNHVTDTNKKIDGLKSDISEVKQLIRRQIT